MGYVHLDIKTDNIVSNHSLLKSGRFQRRRDLNNDLYIIDFGNSERYLLPDGKTHRPRAKVNDVTGNREFLSLNAINFYT